MSIGLRKLTLSKETVGGMFDASSLNQRDAVAFLGTCDSVGPQTSCLQSVGATCCECSLDDFCSEVMDE